MNLLLPWKHINRKNIYPAKGEQDLSHGSFFFFGHYVGIPKCFTLPPCSSLFQKKGSHEIVIPFSSRIERNATHFWFFPCVVRPTVERDECVTNY